VSRTTGLAAFLVATTMVGASIGCSAPASVNGVVRGDGFTLTCDNPLTKPVAAGRDRVVVLAEQDAETLRTVQLTFPSANSLPLNAPIVVGPDGGTQPSLDVMVGKLDVETRSDGVQIISSDNPTTSTSTRGTVTLTELDDAGAAGHFRVNLDDGGYVEGDFTATPAE
jgi:hypothetical protein